jgi:hypothetical protein
VNKLGTAIVGDMSESLDNGFYYPNVLGGEYGAATISPIRYLMNCVRPETQAIVEFGSGWSCNLFQLFVGIGNTRSKAIDYHGAEYTDEGQKTAQRIARYDGGLRYSAHGFDYRVPVSDFLNQYKGHILAFTRHLTLPP